MGYDGKVVFKVDLDTKDFVPQMEQTKKELEDLLEQYDEIQKPLIPGEPFIEGGKAAKYEKEQLTKLAAQIQETANKYIDLKKKQDEVYKGNVKSVKNIGMMDNAMYNKSYSLQYNQLGTAMANVKGQLPYIAEGFKDIGKEVEETGVKAQKAGKEAEKTGKTFDKSFNKGLKTVKKLALGIIGVRSAYMLARRAASAYMAQDEELSSKMQSFWVGLGSFLAPLLETLTNLMMKFLGYLNEFIKALTGRDLISEANAKILEKQAKAQAKLNKETEKYQNYDFDVIRTQQSQTSSGSDTSDTTSGLIEIPELNDKVVKKLQDLAKWLKENKELIEAVGIALGITFGAVAIGKILSGIATLIGSGALMTGLLGLLAVLGMIAIVWSITLIIKGLEELREANRIAKETSDFLDKIAEKTAKTAVETPDIPEVDEKYSKLFERNVDDYIRLHKGASGEEAENYYKTLQKETWAMLQLAKQGRLTKEGYKGLIKFTNEYSDELSQVSQIEGDFKFELQEVYDAINNYTIANSNAVDEIFDLGITTDDTRRKVDKLVQDFLDGKISITEFAQELSKIPKETKTTAKVDTKQATKDVKDYQTTVNETPKEKDTTMNAYEKGAKKKVEEYNTLLASLPTNITTALHIDVQTNDIFDAIKKSLKTSNSTAYDLIKKTLWGKAMGFAKGGLVTQPTMAMIGEAGYNEYVVPETDDYIGRLANLIGQYGSGGGTTNVYLDGRLIQRQVDNTRSRVDFMKNK